MNYTSIGTTYPKIIDWLSWIFRAKDEAGRNYSMGRYMDTTEKVMLLLDKAAFMDVNHSTLLLDQIPPGINTFALLNLPTPPNLTDVEEWRVVYSVNSSTYGNISSRIESIKLLHWHSEMPFYAYHLLLGLYLPLVIIGSLLNTMMLGVTLSSSKLRNDPRNAFILTLAISDFFLCNFTSPLTLWSTLEGHWPLGESTEILCRLVKAGQNFPVIMSSLCIGAIACDRFRFIMEPQKAQMTAKQGFGISFILFLVSCGLVSPVFIQSGLWKFPFMTTKSFYCEIFLDPDSRKYYSALASSIHYLLTLTIVTVLYSLICHRLLSRPPSQHPEVNQRRRRTNILLVCITIVFFVCWGPLVFYTILYEYFPEIFPERMVMVSVGYTLSLLFGMLTPIANPLFYGLFNDPFKDVIKNNFPRAFKALKLLNSLKASIVVHQPAEAQNVESNSTSVNDGRCWGLLVPKKQHVVVSITREVHETAL